MCAMGPQAHGNKESLENRVHNTVNTIFGGHVYSTKIPKPNTSNQSPKTFNKNACSHEPIKGHTTDVLHMSITIIKKKHNKNHTHSNFHYNYNRHASLYYTGKNGHFPDAFFAGKGQNAYRCARCSGVQLYATIL